MCIIYYIKYTHTHTNVFIYLFIPNDDIKQGLKEEAISGLVMRQRLHRTWESHTLLRDCFGT